MMKRTLDIRVWRRAALLATLVVIAGCGEPRPPNVILLVVDTLRADHVSGYGYRRETTPNLDQLMASGVRFDQAIATSSWSAPSHVSIVTGARDDRHGVLNWGQAIRPGVEPLAATLKRRGYATGLFSTHLALHKTTRRIDEGIDEQLVLKNEQDRKVLPAAAEWAAKQRDPYFLYICVMGPHAPYDKYPPALDDQYFTDMPPGGERTYPFSDDEEWIGDGAIPKSVRIGDRHDVGFYVNKYDRAIRYTDQLIGEFLDTLRAAGQLEDTIVVVTSDHGEGFGEHDCFAHELHLYDFLIRVPLILSYPEKVAPGSSFESQVSSIDIVPTILGFVGEEPGKGVDGVDLSPWLTGDERPEPRLAFSSYRSRGYDRYSVRSERYKLILDKKSGREQLVDLIADPSEHDDLLQARGDGFPERAYVGLRANLMTYLAGHHTAVNLPSSFSDPDVLEELQRLGYLGAIKGPPKSADEERGR